MVRGWVGGERVGGKWVVRGWVLLIPLLLSNSAYIASRQDPFPL